jgi:hypothetical protein
LELFKLQCLETKDVENVPASFFFLTTWMSHENAKLRSSDGGFHNVEGFNDVNGFDDDDGSPFKRFSGVLNIPQLDRGNATSIRLSRSEPMA